MFFLNQLGKSSSFAEITNSRRISLETDVGITVKIWRLNKSRKVSFESGIKIRSYSLILKSLLYFGRF